jgi:two-component system sensor histidine kinase DctS
MTTGSPPPGRTERSAAVRSAEAVAEADFGRPSAPEPREAQSAAPLWRSPIAGALLAIALLVSATVGAAIWLSIIDQRRQAQSQLTRLAHDAALTLRGRLLETEQLLLLEGSTYATAPARFRSDMAELLAVNAALMRVELRARDGRPLTAVDATPPRPALGDGPQARPSPEARSALEAAAQSNRLTYSRPYRVELGGADLALLDLVVPTGDPDGPLILATYAPQRMLEHYLPARVASGHLFALVEPDGAVAASQTAPDEARTGLHAVVPLARAGAPLLLRVDALPGPPRSIPNVLTGLVAATSAGLGVAMFLLLRDVRRRARIEQALREQILFRKAVEDAILHALIVFDLDGRIVQVNAATCRITGFGREELVGARPPMPFGTAHSRAAYRAYLQRIADAPDVAAADAERARGTETVFVRKDGSEFEALFVESAVRDQDGRMIGRMVVGVDLTDQKRIEELARRQQEVLQSRSRLATLGEMASTLSHELNQPLAAITSYAAACQNLVDARPLRLDRVQQALRGITGQAERAGQVIRSVQSFLRRRAVDRSLVDLAQLIRGLEPLMRLQAARTGSRIVFGIPAGETVFADRIMLEQVMLNLTRNGFEAMADTPAADRVLELAAYQADGDERGERVAVSVIDRGRGVPPEVVPQLFTPFFTTTSDGMGLGLSLCRSVIEQHGGHLRYRPREGGGSVFSFDLPRHGEPATARFEHTQPGADP